MNLVFVFGVPQLCSVKLPGSESPGELENVYPCPLPHNYGIRASGNEHRISAYLTSVLDDSDSLRILRPSWVGLGDGQQFGDKHEG